MENVLSKSDSNSKGLLWALLAALPLLLLSSAGGVYFLLLAILVCLSVFYVATSGPLKLSRIFDVPVYLTIFVLLNFGFAPLEALWDPDNMMVNLHGNLRVMNKALGFIVVGMIAFWLGCKLVERRTVQPRHVLPQENKAGRILAAGIILYLIGFASKLYLLKAHLFAYTADLDLYKENLANAQVFMFGAQLSTMALIMLGIEKFSGKPRFGISFLFWTVFASECVWGLISGMKSMLLTNLLAVAVVSTLMGGKLARKWLIGAVVGLIVVYPFYNAYRAVVRSQATEGVSDFSSAATALNLAMTVGADAEGSNDEWVESGSTHTLARLDLLQYFGAILNMGDEPKEFHGDAKLWMIPFYPFVPRLVWSTKPVLDDGTKFSVALGSTETSSTAITYPADCYIWGGLAGLIVGMFCLGLVAQRYTNSISGITSKYQVLKYSVILLTCFRIEEGAFPLWTEILKVVPTIFVIGLIAYGFPSRNRVKQAGMSQAATTSS